MGLLKKPDTLTQWTGRYGLRTNYVLQNNQVQPPAQSTGSENNFGFDVAPLPGATGAYKVTLVPPQGSQVPPLETIAQAYRNCDGEKFLEVVSMNASATLFKTNKDSDTTERGRFDATAQYDQEDILTTAILYGTFQRLLL